MDNFTKEELKEALCAIASMSGKAENAKGKFVQGTSQHTLQKNRLKALNIASSLISKELDAGGVTNYSGEDLESAIAPLTSLSRKSEKAQRNLAESTWQYKMLSKNVKALDIASSLLRKALREIN